MLSFFAKRKSAVDLGRYLRRIADQTVGGRVDCTDDSRHFERWNRTIPTLVCPWIDGLPDGDRAVFGLSVNLSNRGGGLLLNQPLGVRHVLLGFWVDPDDAGQPWFFVGESRHEEPIGGGFWRAGVELIAFANDAHPEALRSLRPLAAELLPQAPVAV